MYVCAHLNFFFTGIESGLSTVRIFDVLIIDALLYYIFKYTSGQVHAMSRAVFKNNLFRMQDVFLNLILI